MEIVSKYNIVVSDTESSAKLKISHTHSTMEVGEAQESQEGEQDTSEFLH